MKFPNHEKVEFDSKENGRSVNSQFVILRTEPKTKRLRLETNKKRVVDVDSRNNTGVLITSYTNRK